MRKSTKLFTAIAVAGLITAGGSAFTASNSAPSGQTLGYSSTTVSGGTVNSIAYNLNSNATNVDDVTLVLAGNTTTSAVSMGFNLGTIASCGTGTFLTDHTTYTCDPGTQSPSGLTSTQVVIN